MKQQIEEIIKMNLPEKKEGYGNSISNGGYNGFNNCLSKINTSLIADEVLKIVVEKIKEMKLCYADDLIENEMDYIAGQSHNKQHIIKLLSNLSPNKENKNLKKKKQCRRGCDCSKCILAEAEMSDFTDD